MFLVRKLNEEEVNILFEFYDLEVVAFSFKFRCVGLICVEFVQDYGRIWREEGYVFCFQSFFKIRQNNGMSFQEGV